MIKISDALKELLKVNYALEFCLNRGLLNLTAGARFLRPLLAARTKKEVTESAVVMALSRLGKDAKLGSKPVTFHADQLSVYSDLAVFTFDKSKEAHREVVAVYSRLSKKRAYVSITEGIKQITVIFDLRYLKEVQESISTEPVYRKTDVGAVSVIFPEEYLDTPGFLHLLLEQLTVQGINLIELSSTSTEVIFYLEKGDVRLAFDTLYRRFVR